MAETTEKKLPTHAEQWAEFDRRWAEYETERARYRRGERDTLPPRPVRPHTPGWRI